MFSSYRSFFHHFVFSLIIMYNVVSSDEIPTIMWNIKGNALHVKHVSAVGRSDQLLIDSLEDIHRQKSSILVFALNKLSLEDFSGNDSAMNNTIHNLESFLELKPYMHFPSVKDPLNYIHKAHCGVQEIVVDNKIDESIMKSVSSAMQRSCVVILHVSDDGIVSKEDELKSVFMPSIDNSNKNIVGVFTGVKSSWGSVNSDHHVLRNLLAVSPSDDNFIKYGGCMIMYSENATLQLGKSGNNSVDLPFPPTLDGSSCNSNFSALLQLNFKPSGETLTSVIITLNFTLAGGSWKTSGTLSTTGGEQYDEVDLKTESIAAPSGFSYSCGDMVIKAKNSTYDFSIKFDGFQIQPFQDKEAFSDSFDCVPFFTIPIWMGIFASLLFIIITNIGVYALFSVHTMDRFDDPKGKTITVGTAGD